MKRVTYAGMSFVTTDRIAAEVVGFAVDLANAGGADAIAVPGITLDGERTEFTLVVGPASQLVVDDLTERFVLRADDAEEGLHEQRARRTGRALDG